GRTDSSIRLRANLLKKALGLPSFGHQVARVENLSGDEFQVVLLRRIGNAQSPVVRAVFSLARQLCRARPRGTSTCKSCETSGCPQNCNRAAGRPPQTS